jgi:hypothetical protein
MTKTEPAVKIVEANREHTDRIVHNIYQFLYWYPDNIYPLPNKATKLALNQHMCSQYTILCYTKAIHCPLCAQLDINREQSLEVVSRLKLIAYCQKWK